MSEIYRHGDGEIEKDSDLADLWECQAEDLGYKKQKHGFFNSIFSK